MGYSLYPIFFYLRGIIRNKKMATTLHFNITTKKVKVDQTVSQDLYGIITGPSGVAFITKNSLGNELIDNDTESIYFNLPLDTSNNIVFGTYTIKYGTAIIDPNDSRTYSSESFTYLGADILSACFTVEHNCDYYPTGLISATDSTYYGNDAGTASSPEILSRTISLFYPEGLVNPTPDVNPAIGDQSPITTGNYTLTVDTLATGMWTAIMDVELLYTQDDDLVIEYQLKKTLNHNVACVGQLCSINGCIDGMTQAFNSDVACGVTTPRYAKQLTLINSYFSQYQMERACGNTDKANEYLNLMNELVGGESSCGCSGSGSCSGSCGSSCSCDSCGDDNTPRWINTPGSTTLSVLEQMQGEIDDINSLLSSLDISEINEDILALQDDVSVLQEEVDAVTTLNVDNNLTASNTTMANTELTLTYGVNVITTATVTDYACKLPLPTTGKSLYIINKSNMTVLLFPSMAGGQINNNAIDAPASIPPDGRPYIFICTENPLPGEWTWNPATVAQYDSGVITVADTGTIGNGVISAADSTQYVIGDFFYSSTSWANNGAFKPTYPILIVGNIPGFEGIAFQPSVTWNSIIKVKVYTNISSTSLSGFQWGLTSAVAINSYLPGTSTFNAATNLFAGNLGDFGDVNQTVPGATLGVHELTANVGDPGTAWGELDYSTPPVSQGNISTIGTKYLGIDVNGKDSYSTQYINFCLQPRINNLAGLKFRFLIEYS
jgi:hypothetical protein